MFRVKVVHVIYKLVKAITVFPFLMSEVNSDFSCFQAISMCDNLCVKFTIKFGFVRGMVIGPKKYQDNSLTIAPTIVANN